MDDATRQLMVGGGRQGPNPGHLLGHVIVGYGHPDKKHATWNNPAPLPGTHWPRRLMVSAKGGGLNPGTLLVKGEWGAAEAWMKPNIDPNQ